MTPGLVVLLRVPAASVPGRGTVGERGGDGRKCGGGSYGEEDDEIASTWPGQCYGLLLMLRQLPQLMRFAQTGCGDANASVEIYRQAVSCAPRRSIALLR